MANLYVEKTDPKAIIPERKFDTDSGWDVRAFKFIKVYGIIGTADERLYEEPNIKKYKVDQIDDSLILQPLERALIDTGLKVSTDKGFEIQVRARSGMALKEALTVLNGVGTIDHSYRENLCVIICNISKIARKIKLGDRIAQIVISPVELIKDENLKVGKLPDPETDQPRNGGFGSTGKV